MAGPLRPGPRAPAAPAEPPRLARRPSASRFWGYGVRGGGQDRPHPFEVRANTPLSSFARRAALGGGTGARPTEAAGRVGGAAVPCRAVPCRAVPEAVVGKWAVAPASSSIQTGTEPPPPERRGQGQPAPQEPQGGPPHPGGPPPHPSSPRAAGRGPGRRRAQAGRGVAGRGGGRPGPSPPAGPPERGGCHRRSNHARSGTAPGAPHHPAVGRPRGASRPAGEARRGGGVSEPGEGPPARARGGSGPRPLTSSLRGGLGCLPLSPRPPGC